MPPSFAPLDGFVIQTGDKNNFAIELATYPKLTNTEPGKDNSINYTSSIKILTDNAIGATDSTYQFTIFVSGDLPIGSYFTLQVPETVTLPTNNVAGMTFTCSFSCDSSSVQLSWTSSTRLITVKNVFTALGAYVREPGPLVFEISGATNPTTNTKAYFVWTSYAVLNGQTYMVDQISQIYLQATRGQCNMLEVYPSDGNYMIYGVAESWYFKVSCKSPILTNYGVRVTFPADWYVITTSSCTMGGQSQDFVCSALNSDGTITVYNFLDSRLAANQVWSFTVDSVRNPGVLDKAYTLTVETLSQDGGSIDSGTYEMEDTRIVKGEIWEFTVTPQNFGVGQYPVSYDFVIKPSGEIYANAYLVITMPDEVQIASERLLEKNCTSPSHIIAFTTPVLQCSLAIDDIVVSSGFADLATTNMTRDDKMVTPRLEFTLPQFLNPRTTQVSKPFGLSIFSEERVEIYTWDPTYAVTVNGETITDGSTTEGPAVVMSVAATPQAVSIAPISKKNGVITDVIFTITTTNSLIEGDQIKIVLPKPVFFTESSKCEGFTDNLRSEQTSTLSEDLTEMTITLLLPKYRRLQTVAINAGQTFQLKLTKIKNSQSTRPTTGSVSYSSYTQGYLIETLSVGLTLANEEPGEFDSTFMQIRPEYFLKSALSNYTLTFRPQNYEQNMQIVLGLPKQIRLGDKQNIHCYGAQGTDSLDLKCSLNLTARTITVKNAVTFQSSNPGLIKIIYETFQNPDNNIKTSPFVLTTYTSDGFVLDRDNTSLVIDFFCQFPCASCSPFDKTRCFSCYTQDLSFSYFHEYQCWDVCPSGYIGTDQFNCTKCVHPCATCSEDSSTCDSCVEGYRMRLFKSQCVRQIYWPFPYLAMAVFSFVLIGISEICTKTKSRFKEAFIAALSIPEILSWVTFLIWHAIEHGFLGSFALASIALLLYILINWIHACIHSFRMITKAPKSYQTLKKNYMLSTALMRLISYLVSFKFSLLMISHFFLNKRFKGDYSPLNWKQFQRFSLAWVLFCYPIIMLATVYYLITQTLFSYTGYLAIEVILISTLSMGILLVDAISACKCRVQPNRQILPYRQGEAKAVYESEDESSNKRILKKRNNKELEEFGGADESQPGDGESRTSFIKPNEQTATHLMSEERRRHLQMLEELARQMRAEKEQLRLERERIKRERWLLEHGDDDEDYYGIDSQRQAVLREEDHHGQVITFRDQNQQLIQSREEIEEYGEEQEMVRKDYHNIEAEMRDEYDEEQQLDVDEAGPWQVSQLPNVPPRAGGDSIQGRSDLIGDYDAYLDLGSRKSAIYSHIDDQCRTSIQLDESFLEKDSAYIGQEPPEKYGSRETSEVYQQNQDAQKEAQSDLSDELRTPYELLVMVAPVFGKIDKDEDNKHSEVHFDTISASFNAVSSVPSEKPKTPLHESQEKSLDEVYFRQEAAVQSQCTPPATRIDDDKIIGFTLNDSTAQGEGEPPEVLNEEPDLKELVELKSRQATPEQFFEQESASQGSVVEEKQATPIECIEDNSALASQLLKAKERKLRQIGGDYSGTVTPTEEQQADSSNDRHMAFGSKKSDGFRNVIKDDNVVEVDSDYVIQDNDVVEEDSDYVIQDNDMVQEDQDSGFSQSSEGIVDHHPFATAQQNVNQKRNQYRVTKVIDDTQILDPSQDLKAPTLDAKDRRKQAVAQSQALPTREKRPIIYSDKSESSIDEMMGDTPSNYNLANGRIDGVSKGLKAIFFQHLVSGQALQTKLDSILPSQNLKEEFKQHTTTETDEKNFVNQLKQQTNRSGTGWRDINQTLKQNNRSRDIVIEQSSTDDQQFVHRKKQKAIKTNKVFTENHDNVRSLVSPPRHPQGQDKSDDSSNSSTVKQQVQTNNFV